MKDILYRIADIVKGPFVPHYAVKPSEDEAQRKHYPYKLYKATLFGTLEPKNYWHTNHRYTVDQAAAELAKCLSRGSKVSILDQEALPGPWKDDLLDKLNKHALAGQTYGINAGDTVKFRKRQRSHSNFRPEKYDTFNPIEPVVPHSVEQ